MTRHVQYGLFLGMILLLFQGCGDSPEATQEPVTTPPGGVSNDTANQQTSPSEDIIETKVIPEPAPDTKLKISACMEDCQGDSGLYHISMYFPPETEPELPDSMTEFKIGQMLNCAYEEDAVLTGFEFRGDTLDLRLDRPYTRIISGRDTTRQYAAKGCECFFQITAVLPHFGGAKYFRVNGKPLRACTESRGGSKFGS